MKKVFLAVMAIVLLPALQAGAQQGQVERTYDRVDIRVNYWPASYNGEIKLEDRDEFGGTTTIKGDDLELEDDLGVENPQDVWEVSAGVRLGKSHRLAISYFSAAYEGSERVDTEVDIAGLTFQADTDVDTNFDFSRIKFMYTWFPLMAEQGRLGLSAGVDYYTWRIEAEGTEVNLGQEKSEEFELPAPIPVLGIDGQLNIAYGFGVYASFSGMGISYEDWEGSFTDFEGGLTWDYKWAHVGVGYRTIDSYASGEEDDDEEFEMAFSHNGVLASIGVNF